MSYLLLEDPTWICAICGVLALLFAWRWWRSRSRADLRRLLYPVVAAVGVVVLAAAVVTDREKIDALVHRILREAGAGNLSTLESRLTPGFTAQVRRPLDRESALREGRRALTRYRIGQLEGASVVTEVKDARATSRVSVRWRSRRRASRAVVPFRIALTWQKNDKRWQVSRADVRMGFGM